MDGTVAASAVSSVPVSASVAQAHVTASPAPVVQSANPVNFANMMAATIEAALKTLREKIKSNKNLDATDDRIVASRIRGDARRE